MRFHVLTLFPDLFTSPLSDGLIAKGRERGLIDWQLTDIRDFATDRHRTVDDAPFGGGEGMVMKPDVVARALDHASTAHPRARRVLLTPQGRRFDQGVARELLEAGEVILLCGRYEGVDERVTDDRIDDCLSIGDFILGGGELAAMVVMETVFRLVPGVLGNRDSVDHDTFSDGLLKHPQYTRPAVHEERPVPRVLSSGDHGAIARWRHQQSLERTWRRRPDLSDAWFQRHRDEVSRRLYVALLHHPVTNKKGQVVATAVTNSDIHDISRASRTYNLGGYFIVTPVVEQRRLVGQILGHWQRGRGAEHNPTRRDAMKRTRVVGSLDDARAAIGRRHKSEPLTVVTSARESDEAIRFSDLRYRLAAGPRPILLLFGTGWGLTPEFMSCMDRRLEPIRGVGGYNHLSVRSAVSIILDRILGG
jgi:tRNA (guanine37-N1)-methyltransferase